MNRLSAIFCISFVAAALLIFFPASDLTAQSSGNVGETYQVYELGEVVVSGDRGTYESPTTISSVSGVDIETDNAQNLGEAIQSVPGVYFRQGRAKQEAYVSVRGFEQDKVLILLDGVPIYQPYEGLVNLNDIPVQNIARIKVVKGLSSPLYGANAMGGVVNIITKKGGDDPYTALSYKVSDYNTHHLEATHGQRIGDFSYFLGLSHKESDGFSLAEPFTLPESILTSMAQAPSPISHTPIKSDSGLRDNSDYNRDAVTLTGSWDMNPDNTLGLSFEYYDNDYGITPTALYRETRKSGGTAHWYPRYWQFENWNRYTVGLTEESQVTDTFRVKARLFYDDYKSELDAYDDDTYSTQLRTAGAPSFDSEYDDYNAGASVYGFWDGIEDHSIRLAYHYKRDVHTSLYAYADSPAGYEKLASHTTSAALEDEIMLRDGLGLTLGASYDTFEQDDREQEDGSDIGDTISAFNPQIGLRFSPTADVDLYTSAGKKTRFPTMRNLYANGVIGPQGDPDLEEEETLSYELGGEWRPCTAFTVEGALFYNDIDDLILFDNQIGRFEQYQKARTYGIELGALARFSEHLEARVDYTYLVAENNSGAVTVETEYLAEDLVYVPDQIPYRPKHKIDVNLNRSFDFGLNVHLSGSYVADQFYYNHADATDNTIYVAVKEKLDDYFLLNTKITYDINDRYQIMVAVDNLLDEEYQELYLSPAPGITTWFGLKLSL